jgi:aminoglycoside phosphotransferase (APT) family kinase protein
VAVLDFYGPLVSDPAIDFGRLVQHWDEAFALAALRFYDRPVDPAFRERMVLYARLEPLRTFAGGVALGEERWLRWGRRRLAAYAGRSSPD